MHPWGPLGNNVVVTPDRLPAEDSDKVGEELALNLTEREHATVVLQTKYSKNNNKNNVTNRRLHEYRFSSYSDEFLNTACVASQERIQVDVIMMMMIWSKT